MCHSSLDAGYFNDHFKNTNRHYPVVKIWLRRQNGQQT